MFLFYDEIYLKVNFAYDVCCLLQVCPVCAMRVGVDMVAHITLQHGNIFKVSFLLSRDCFLSKVCSSIMRTI